MAHVCAHLHVVSTLGSVPVSMSLYCINMKLGMYTDMGTEMDTDVDDRHILVKK
jgi:hypothetical protein